MRALLFAALLAGCSTVRLETGGGGPWTAARALDRGEPVSVGRVAVLLGGENLFAGVAAESLGCVGPEVYGRLPLVGWVLQQMKEFPKTVKE